MGAWSNFVSNSRVPHLCVGVVGKSGGGQGLGRVVASDSFFEFGVF